MSPCFFPRALQRTAISDSGTIDGYRGPAAIASWCARARPSQVLPERSAMKITFSKPSVPQARRACRGGRREQSKAAVGGGRAGQASWWRPDARHVRSAASKGKQGRAAWRCWRRRDCRTAGSCCVGIGKPDGPGGDLDLENFGGACPRSHEQGRREVEAALVIESLARSRTVPAAAERAARLGYGALLRSYRFDKYRTKEKPEKKPSLKSLSTSCCRRSQGRQEALHAPGQDRRRRLLSPATWFPSRPT